MFCKLTLYEVFRKSISVRCSRGRGFESDRNQVSFVILEAARAQAEAIASAALSIRLADRLRTPHSRDDPIEYRLLYVPNGAF